MPGFATKITIFDLDEWGMNQITPYLVDSFIMRFIYIISSVLWFDIWLCLDVLNRYKLIYLNNGPLPPFRDSGNKGFSLSGVSASNEELNAASIISFSCKGTKEIRNSWH
jgi:hypothetical protein